MFWSFLKNVFIFTITFTCTKINLWGLPSWLKLKHYAYQQLLNKPSPFRNPNFIFKPARLAFAQVMLFYFLYHFNCCTAIWSTWHVLETKLTCILVSKVSSGIFTLLRLANQTTASWNPRWQKWSNNRADRACSGMYVQAGMYSKTTFLIILSLCTESRMWCSFFRHNKFTQTVQHSDMNFDLERWVLLQHTRRTDQKSWNTPRSSILLKI